MVAASRKHLHDFKRFISLPQHRTFTFALCCKLQQLCLIDCFFCSEENSAFHSLHSLCAFSTLCLIVPLNILTRPGVRDYLVYQSQITEH